MRQQSVVDGAVLTRLPRSMLPVVIHRRDRQRAHDNFEDMLNRRYKGWAKVY
jgi:hypothetical protein